MAGRAPELFRHDSPDGRSHDASLMLVNLWIPLHQITQPLVPADGRRLDRRRHQLRSGLPTGSFLDREDEMAVDDIWTMLHDSGREWCFHFEMDHRSADVSNTLSAPHGAGSLTGEDVAERGFRALDAMDTLVDEARSDPSAVCGSGREGWVERSRAARRAVVCTSIGMRIVVSVER